MKWGEQYSARSPRLTSLSLSWSCCAGIKQTRQACSQLSAKKIMKEQVSRAKPSHPDQPSGEFNFAQVLQQQCLGVAAPAATAAEWPRGRGRGCPFWGRGRGCPFWGWGCPWGRGCPVLVVWSRAGSPRELALPGSVPGDISLSLHSHSWAGTGQRGTAGLREPSEGRENPAPPQPRGASAPQVPPGGGQPPG